MVAFDKFQKVCQSDALPTRDKTASVRDPPELSTARKTAPQFETSRAATHWRLLATAWMAAFLVSFDYTAVNVALPTLAADFGVGTSQVSWIALAYMLAMASLTLAAGSIISRLGYFRALTAGLALFALASLVCALAPTFWLLVAMRAAQGIGASVMFVIGPAMIKALVADDAQARAFAVYSTGPMAGLCAGPAIGGQITALLGWQAVFFITLAATAASWVLLCGVRGRMRRSPDPSAESHAALPPSALTVLALAGLLSLLAALNQGDEWGWSSPGIVALFLVACISLAGVIAMNHRSVVPLIDRQILRSRDFTLSAMIFFLLLTVFGGSVFIMPFYFQWLRKMDTNAVGNLLLIQPIATIAVSALAGVGLVGFSRRALCIAGIVLLAAGVSMFATIDRDTPLFLVIAVMVLIGAASGLYYPALLQLSMENLAGDLAAAAASVQTTVRVLAQLLGVVLFETIFSQLYPTALGVERAVAARGKDLIDMQSAFQSVFWCAAAIAALALLPAVLLRRATADAIPDTEVTE